MKFLIAVKLSKFYSPADVVRLDGLPESFNEVLRRLGPGRQLDVADGRAAVTDAEVDVTRVDQEVTLIEKVY